MLIKEEQMKKSLYLKMGYPDWRFTSRTATALYLAGCLFTILALTGIISVKEFSESLGLSIYISTLIATIGLAVAMFMASPRVRENAFKKAWRKAFFLNNEDLELDYGAIDQVVNYFQVYTTYSNPSFENIAHTIASLLREPDPYQQEMHTTFTWEVLHAYRHFSVGDMPLPESNCPRDKKK